MKRFTLPSLRRTRAPKAAAVHHGSGCLDLQLHLEPDQVRALERVRRAWHEKDGFGGGQLPDAGRVALALLFLALEEGDPEATRSVVHVGPVS